MPPGLSWLLWPDLEGALIGGHFISFQPTFSNGLSLLVFLWLLLCLFSLASVFPSVLLSLLAASYSHTCLEMYVFKSSEPSAGFILVPFSDQHSEENLENTLLLLFVFVPKHGMNTLIFKDWLLMDYLLDVRHLERKQHLQLNIFRTIYMVSTVCLIWIFCHPAEYRHISSYCASLYNASQKYSLQVEGKILHQ